MQETQILKITDFEAFNSDLCKRELELVFFLNIIKICCTQLVSLD